MSTHTHRGHCQVCLRAMAIDTTTGRLALHGYNVEGHQFTGTCAGSNELSLHVSRVITDTLIEQAHRDVARMQLEIEALDAGTAHPAIVWKGTMTSYGRWEGVYEAIRTTRIGRPDRISSEPVMISWADASTDERAQQVKVDRLRLVFSQKMAADFAKERQYWADRICGKVDAYRVQDLEAREWTVGDTVRIGGVKGYDAIIEEIADRPYRTSGFRQGARSIMCPHARITQPAVTEKRVSEAAGGYVTRAARPEKIIWEALRNIKRPPNVLAAELKKANKL